jgi:peptidoglycan/LPS O-acetylase OafA/YrhL
VRAQSSSLAGASFSNRHIRSLDGLRGVAFLLVFFRHFGLTSHATARWVKVIAAVSYGGWMGVDLFFVLSGFLITGILLDTREDPRYFANFYIRRALRIFPVYYTVLGVLLLLTPLFHLDWHWGHTAYWMYLGNIAYNLSPGLSVLQPSVSFVHLWSLAVEEQFYLIWPLVVMVVASRRRLAYVCGWLSVGGLALRLSLLALLPRGIAYEWCYFQLPTHMDGLLFGAVAAIGIRSMPVEQATRSARRILPFALGSLGLVIGISGFDFHSVAMMTAGLPALAATFACVVLLALRPGSVVYRCGDLKALRFVGRYSYGMYLFHILFLPGLAWMQPWLQGRLHSVVLGGICFVSLMFGGTLGTAVLSYEVYEKQWLKLKSRFSYDAINKTEPEFAA